MDDLSRPRPENTHEGHGRMLEPELDSTAD
jgi:hypothetical protein